MILNTTALLWLFLTPFLAATLSIVTRSGPRKFLGLIAFVSAVAFNLPRLGMIFNSPWLYTELEEGIVLYDFFYLSADDAQSHWLFPPIMWASLLSLTISLWGSRPKEPQSGKNERHA